MGFRYIDFPRGEEGVVWGSLGGSGGEGIFNVFSMMES